MRITPRRLALGMSLWIPNLCSGIRVRRFSDDWTRATVELHVNLLTRGVLTAEFEVTREKAEELRQRAHGGAKVLEWFETVITDRHGDVVAKVRREVYIREKKRVTAARG
ncbi:hypothetical protein AB0N68_14420 [Microbacterium sp. NPDC089313]|uniref:hypothetical protein n=1 Tax=Microbacterium sp. NPDC089313 TaxID=3154973 RepID=UPI0034309FB0